MICVSGRGNGTIYRSMSCFSGRIMVQSMEVCSVLVVEVMVLSMEV